MGFQDRATSPVKTGPGWRLSVYPAAGEAGGRFYSSRDDRRTNGAVDAPPVDPERSRLEAGRRARGKLRRYCAANRLSRLGTLTYGPPFCTDPRQVRLDVAAFIRNLRGALGGAALPYAWVPELHRDGQRYHLHFAVGRYIPRTTIDDAWGHGFISIKLLSNMPAGTTEWDRSRRAAQYLGKYVSKSFEAHHGGLHRYEVGQGFQPDALLVTGKTAAEAIERASLEFGSPASFVWRSRDLDYWPAPPAVWASWS